MLKNRNEYMNVNTEAILNGYSCSRGFHVEKIEVHDGKSCHEDFWVNWESKNESYCDNLEEEQTSEVVPFTTQACIYTFSFTEQRRN